MRKRSHDTSRFIMGLPSEPRQAQKTIRQIYGKNTPIRQSIHLPLCFPVFHGCHAIFVSKNALVGSHIAKTGIDSDSLNRIMLEIFQQHKRIIESRPIDVSVEIFACESLQ